MRHQLRPSINGLENKALLSSLAVGLMGHHPVLHAEIQRADPMGAVVDRRVVQHSVLQAEVPGPVTTQAPWMACTVSTDQTTYNLGRVVDMHLTITNVSNIDHTITLGSGRDGFSITQNGNLIWQQVQTGTVVNQNLDPGQSITLSAQYTTTTTGTFVVWNQMCPDGPTATFNVVITSGQR